MSYPNAKSCVASSKTYNKAGIFVANSKDINNVEENIDILEDSDKKLKPTFYTSNENDELSKKKNQYDDNEIKNVIPLEQLKIWNICHILVIYDKVYFYANDDNSSFWVKDKEPIIKKKRPKVSNYGLSYYKARTTS
ncbi:8454_t:CDS:2 [Cetraspora pellucida]|uniref:8454_t:CDS:1 n=1 Tax=Cetraspora pellucida TaxID=1433469 RepID=A0A9N9DKW2_9GLOM|nr:8454_t:CDS:2 [Cetraspora pellucida]